MEDKCPCQALGCITPYVTTCYPRMVTAGASPGAAYPAKAIVTPSTPIHTQTTSNMNKALTILLGAALTSQDRAALEQHRRHHGHPGRGKGGPGPGGKGGPGGKDDDAGRRKDGPGGKGDGRGGDAGRGNDNGRGKGKAN